VGIFGALGLIVKVLHDEGDVDEAKICGEVCLAVS
jgi:hypothetical protein